MMVPDPDYKPTSGRKENERDKLHIPNTFRSMRGKMLDRFFIPNDKGEVAYVAHGFSSTTLDESVIEMFRDKTNFNVKVKIR